MTVRCRSGFSFREAAGNLDDVLSRLVEIGMKEAPLTDRASTFGFYRWSKAAKKAGLRPIFGVELAVTRSLNEKKPTFDHVTFVAKDSLAPINRLVELATSQFRYRPLLTDVQAYAAEGVYRILGHRAQIADVDIPKDTYLALGPSTPLGLARLAIDREIPFIASSDNRYPRESDRGFYEVLTGRNAETQTYPQHILSEEEWERSVAKLAAQLPERDLRGALEAAEYVRAGSTADLTRAVLLAPPRPATLREMCVRGAAELECDLSRPEYAARLDRELGLIADKAFEDYFYIVADLCQYARGEMIVGPARGSSCGSLVCYLLRITTVDPIPFGLIFERFIDINRSDLPDIDLDFADTQRYKVFDYLKAKYGEDRVARLGTVAMFKPRSALQECGAALRVPRFKTEAVAESLVVRSSADARALDTLSDTLTGMPAGRALMEEYPEMTVATRFEGHPRHHSQHAAGVVIAERPVVEIVAIDRRTGATMCDKKDAEDGYNLLKIDALGLTQLSVFERALELIGIDRTKSFSFLDSLPLDDPAAFRILNDQKWSGIFQFNGTALQGITKQFVADKFDDIVTITALGRPGPMASGGAQEWIYRRIGDKPIEYPHEMFEPHLKATLGVIVFQEQIMNIGREIGGLSWEDVTSLRKAMSKSLGKEYFDQFGDRWKKGAIEKGVPADKINKIWDDLCAYGSWCLDGDEEVMLAREVKGQKTIKIRDLAKMKTLPVLQSLGEDGRVRWQRPTRVFVNGRKECIRVSFEDGSPVTCTGEHEFLINGSWGKGETIRVGDDLTFADWKGDRKELRPRGAGMGYLRGRKSANPRFQASGEDHAGWIDGASHYKAKFKKENKGNPCAKCGETPDRMEVHHEDFCHGQERPNDLAWLCTSCHAIIHREHGNRLGKGERGKPTKQVKVTFVKKVGKKDVYDIEMPGDHNYCLASGLVAHNCFNQSHSVAYGLVSYWCCWLKAHHPFEFAAATLSFEPDPDKQIKMLREMRDEGFEYVPVDPDVSTELWEVGSKDGRRVLVGPLSGVKGIGPKMISDIIGRRNRRERLTDRQKKLLDSPKTPIDSLWPIRDAFGRVMPDPLERNIMTPPTPIREVVPRDTDYEALVFCVLRKINPRDENEAVKVARRGGKEITSGPTTSLELYLADDTDTIFGKIGRFDYERIGKGIVERGKGLRSLYAVKGRIRADAGFRMMTIKNVRYIGDVGEDVELAPTSN